MEAWMPVVRRLRPQTAWPEVAAAVNGVLPPGSRRFTEGRLVGSVQFLVAEGLADAAIVGKAPRRKPRKGVSARQRACDAIAGLLAGRPGITLVEMGGRAGAAWTSPTAWRRKLGARVADRAARARAPGRVGSAGVEVGRNARNSLPGR
jgi:hypothetical protein